MALNVLKAKDWLSIANKEIRNAEDDLKNKKFPSAVFHAQLATELYCKAILITLGIEPGKTHNPSQDIWVEVLPRAKDFKICRKNYEILNKIQIFSTTLEDQGVSPRYGWETKDRIITPEEIYDEEKSKSLVRTAAEIKRLTFEFMENRFEKAKELFGDVLEN